MGDAAVRRQVLTEAMLDGRGGFAATFVAVGGVVGAGKRASSGPRCARPATFSRSGRGRPGCRREAALAVGGRGGDGGSSSDQLARRVAGSTVASGGSPHRWSVAGLTNTVPRLAGGAPGGWLPSTPRSTTRSSRWAASVPRRTARISPHPPLRRTSAAPAGRLPWRLPSSTAGELDGEFAAHRLILSVHCSPAGAHIMPTHRHPPVATNVLPSATDSEADNTRVPEDTSTHLVHLRARDQG